MKKLKYTRELIQAYEDYADRSAQKKPEIIIISSIQGSKSKILAIIISRKLEMSLIPSKPI